MMVVVVSSIAEPGVHAQAACCCLAIGLVTFCSLAFVAGLKLPIPLCPALEFLEQFAVCRV